LFAATISAGSAATAGTAAALAEVELNTTFKAISEKKSPNYGNEKITSAPN